MEEVPRTGKVILLLNLVAFMVLYVLNYEMTAGMIISSRHLIGIYMSRRDILKSLVNNNQLLNTIFYSLEHHCLEWRDALIEDIR